MRLGRLKWLLLVLPLSLGIAHFDRAANLSPGNWREASRASIGLAPDPATTREAVAQVYAARAVRWRGYFGVHTWIAVKPTDADHYTVYEVTRWQRRRNGSVVSISERPPDGRWYGNAPELLAEIRGAGVDEVITRIHAAAEAYPYVDTYHVWPGPNSNTFTAFVLREAAPELRADLPPTAIGKDYLGLRLIADAPSGTGKQVSLFGLLGVMLAVEEGMEINLLGMTFGIDPFALGIKLPFAGDFGLRPTATAYAQEPEQKSPARRYTFSWPYSAASAMQPRGGTTRGPSVNLATTPAESWERLRAPGLTKFERDRRAILAMAGEFRTSFDFIETVGFSAAFEPAQPYQSWATETVDVIEDTGDRISLQHVIVMRYLDEDGNVQGPFVQKHWRQDWIYEDLSIHAYSGNRTWTEQRYAPAAVTGRWSQAVYQVDDSPRYEALGDWVHRANYSAWTSDETWRPLPRRESSVRDDYDVLIGTNRHTITPGGWVHEEDNLKAALDETGALEADAFRSREVGVNRYERIEDFDFSARDDYWSATAAFWADVRAEWRAIYAERASFTLNVPAGAPPLFEPMFVYAAELEAGRSYDPEAGRAFIRSTLDDYVD